MALARAYASDAGAQVTSDAVQLHGWTPRSFAVWLRDNAAMFS
jgi:alkylation response protein AidB-like acyl-CoA dehydrogenase